MEENKYGILSSGSDDEEKKLDDMLNEFALNRSRKDFYSRFSNLPNAFQKRICINIFLSIVVFFMCIGVFILYYQNILLLLVGFVVPFYLTVQTWAICHNFKTMDFIEFSGKVVESHPMGSRFLKTSYYLVKLEAENGRTLCFRYYDRKLIYFDEMLTLFIRRGTKIETTEHGPLISSYIDVIPTEEVEMRMESFKKRNAGNNSDTIDGYLGRP